MIFGSASVPLLFTQFAFVTDWFVGANYASSLGINASISFAAVLAEDFISSKYFETSNI